MGLACWRNIRQCDSFTANLRSLKALLYADPFDVEAQRKIEAAIRQENRANLFSKIDVDKHNYIVAAELRAFLLGAELEEMRLDQDNVMEKVMKDLDTQSDSKITFDKLAR